MLDQQWKEHLLRLDQLRQGISLRAYGQKDPLNEYKREAFMMFEQLLESLRETTTTVLAHVEVRPQQTAQQSSQQSSQQATQAGDTPAASSAPAAKTTPPRKISRNETCPCGSGRKYKHCHGALA